MRVYSATQLSPMDTLITLKKMISFRRCFFIVCFILTILYMWFELTVKVNNFKEKYLFENFEEIYINNQSITDNFSQNQENIEDNLKYILFWTQTNFHPFTLFKEGQKTFIDSNCPVTNCYVTGNKNYFRNDFTKFHAIVFNGRNIKDINLKNLPTKRSQKQKYIYINYEPAEYYPVCSNIFNDFFNWTWTYKLDSDIPDPYFKITDIDGEIIGPKRNMEWKKTFHEEYINEHKWHNKSKAVAWFVSRCKSLSNREKYAEELKNELLSHGAILDIYGPCGPLKCPRSKENYCDAILNKDYYFYLSFENSFCEDYVTEKILTPLQNNAVPIVLGGADYNRFLPPGSYLDANKMPAEKLATKIINIIESPEVYSQFHRWKSQYKYYNLKSSDIVCKMCAVLNNQTFYEKESVNENFTSWWHPNFKKRCRKLY